MSQDTYSPWNLWILGFHHLTLELEVNMVSCSNPPTHTELSMFYLLLLLTSQVRKFPLLTRLDHSLCCRPPWHLFKLWYIFAGIFCWFRHLMFCSFSVWDVKTWKECMLCLVLNSPFWVAFLTAFKFGPAFFPIRSIPSIAVVREHGKKTSVE